MANDPDVDLPLDPPEDPPENEIIDWPSAPAADEDPPEDVRGE